MRIDYRIQIIKATIQDCVADVYPGSHSTMSYYHTSNDTTVLTLKLYDFGFNPVTDVTHTINIEPVRHCNPASIYQYGRVVADRMITKLGALEYDIDLHRCED